MGRFRFALTPDISPQRPSGSDAPQAEARSVFVAGTRAPTPQRKSGHEWPAAGSGRSFYRTMELKASTILGDLSVPIDALPTNGRRVELNSSACEWRPRGLATRDNYSSVVARRSARRLKPGATIKQGGLSMQFLKAAVAAGLVIATFTGNSLAQSKPSELKIGITTFLSGPASVFGVPAKAAAEMIAEDLNKKGGIGGVPVKLSFIDEGAGGEALVSNYRRVVQDEKVDATFASISSGSCTQLVPVAEDLKVMNFMWDCGAASILETKKYRYNFRTQANGTPEMLAVLLYLLKTKPDFKTIAVVNQDYAWGRESWEIFSTALKAMKPDVQVVAELFPKFGAPDYSTEVSRLLALRPDVVLTTSWGGDLDTLVRQAGQRGLLQQSTFVLGIGESSIQRLGKDLPEGLIVGARGDHWFLHPEKKNDAAFKAFNEAFKAKTGAWPIYPVYHMAQAFKALQTAYDKAIKSNGGNWPTREQVVDATAGIEFATGFGRPITLRPEDNQGLEAQLVGVTKSVPGYDFKLLDNMMIFDPKMITNPAGVRSVEWLKTLKPDFVKMDVPTFKAQ
ncbi:ABC transporter substrate-binding protein [Bradyrhizobium sp. SUTN9-2]|uniref:ABC transporter substrate-binding protein n=1 Tax=Bradyrhizobium sp. SUTN9-2 TaxID=1167456 RepID=UPI001FCEFB42|nr:ABC transporter substrate-binding protein [Bradyrhizobium sp. SUTN9-2]